jgi:polysaccharide biosynthesis/export protein
MNLKKIIKLLLGILLIIQLTNCTVPKNMYYLKDLNNLQDSTSKILQNSDSKIEIGDRVSIIVSCADPSQTSFLNPFNNQNPGVNSSQSGIGYLVDSMGQIDFPLVGKVNLNGLNSQYASNLIKEKLKGYFRDPYVYVTLNGKVSVLNGRGGYSIQITNERLSIFDALAQQGSYEPDDLWNEVLIIRETNGKRITAYVDLTSKEVLNSPYYYLQNRDIIYVKPGKLNATMRSTSTVRSTIGMATGIIALILLIFKK